MLIKDIMGSPAITVSPAASLADAARLMLDHDIGGLPVVDADYRLLGIITESDFLRRAELGTEMRRPRWLEYFRNTGKMADEYVRAHGRKVDEVMQLQPVTCTPEDSLTVAVEAMLGRHIKRLPVMQDGRVVGIVSRSDLLRAAARLMRGQQAGAPSDAQVKAEIDTQLGAQTWTSGLIETSVKEGIVTLEGTVFDARQQQAAHVLVENVAGVKSVVDRLVWIEPSSATVLGPVDFSAR